MISILRLLHSKFLIFRAPTSPFPRFVHLHSAPAGAAHTRSCLRRVVAQHRPTRPSLAQIFFSSAPMSTVPLAVGKSRLAFNAQPFDEYLHGRGGREDLRALGSRQMIPAASDLQQRTSVRIPEHTAAEAVAAPKVRILKNFISM